MLDTEQIATILTVAETGSMRKATRILHCTQPALSYRLKVIESRIGCKIFDRCSSGLKLTIDGKQVYTAAQQLSKAIEHFDETLCSIRTGTVNALFKIGMPSDLFESIASPLLEITDLKDRSVIEPVDLQVTELNQALDSGMVDFIISRQDIKNYDRGNAIELLKEPVFLVHAHKANDSFITPTQLCPKKRIAIKAIPECIAGEEIQKTASSLLQCDSSPHYVKTISQVMSHVLSGNWWTILPAFAFNAFDRRLELMHIDAYEGVPLSLIGRSNGEISQLYEFLPEMTSKLHAELDTLILDTPTLSSLDSQYA